MTISKKSQLEAEVVLEHFIYVWNHGPEPWTGINRQGQQQINLKSDKYIIVTCVFATYDAKSKCSHLYRKSFHSSPSNPYPHICLTSTTNAMWNTILHQCSYTIHVYCHNNNLVDMNDSCIKPIPTCSPSFTTSVTSVGFWCF